MTPTDEITAVGYALDQYANQTQKTQDNLNRALRRQRREINHFLMIFESIPDGVVVQDLDGRVVVMNEKARELLGSQRVFRTAGLYELQDLVSANLGAALAPGVYALGDPHRVNLDGKVLSAQAAAILSETQHRIGTVVLLRDITSEIRKERERDMMLEQLAEEIQQPLALIGQAGDVQNLNLMRVLVKEITRQSVALQKLIMDLRELSNVDTVSVQRRQRPLSLETLVWALTNDWRQIAQADSLTLHVIIQKHGLFILGDEKRLRWAIGNVIDNAIKYTLPGGALTLEVQPDTGEGRALLRVRDNGVGISREDRHAIFTRFFRGTPVTADGQVIRVPGMGQGLYIAKQIIESHGGMIYVKSSQNVGTAVYISLPQTAPVGLELPRFNEMDGETQQLPESLLIEIDDRTQAD
jgi:PAS domain S-box-containing protein